MFEEKDIGQSGANQKKQNLPALTILIIAVCGLLGLAFWIFSPFISTIIAALVLVAIGHPLYSFVLRILGPARRGAASAITCLSLIFLVIAPMVWIGWSIVREAPAGLKLAKSGVQGVARRLEGYSWFQELKRSSWYRKLSDRAEDSIHAFEDALTEGRGKEPEGGEAPGGRDPGTDRGDAKAPPRESLSMEKAASYGYQIGAWVARLATGVLANLLGVLFKFIFMLFILFFFFKDGPEILKSLRRAIPLEESALDKMIETFRLVSRSIIRGTLGTALIQGAVATVAFLIVGIPALFWGVIVAVSALVPPVGTGLVLLPITIFLFLGAGKEPEGGLDWFRGIFMAVATVGIGTMDNFLRPLLVGKSLHLHPLWLLLSILGALAAFGPMGLIYGPMVLVLLSTVIALLLGTEEKEDPVASASPVQAAPAGTPGKKPAF